MARSIDKLHLLIITADMHAVLPHLHNKVEVAKAFSVDQSYL